MKEASDANEKQAAKGEEGREEPAFDRHTRKNEQMHKQIETQTRTDRQTNLNILFFHDSLRHNLFENRAFLLNLSVG